MRLYKTIFLSGLFLTLIACNKTEQTEATGQQAKQMPPPVVEVVSPHISNTALTQTALGKVQAYRSAEVRARVDGIVAQRLFQEGSEVKAGTPLFKIDAYISQADLTSSQAETEFAQQKLERLRPLLAAQAISKQEFELAVLQSKQANAQWQKLQRDVKNAHVPAPITGYIGRSLVSEGSLVKQSSADLLARIDQLDPVYVDFEQPAAEMLQLKQSLKQEKLKVIGSAEVQLTLPDGRPYKLAGKLLFSDAVMNPENGNVRLRAQFSNPERELLPNMLVKISFANVEQTSAMRIPQAAVSTGPQGAIVMIVDAEGKANPRPIKLGRMIDSDFIVEQGLNGNEQIIVNGLQKARPGTPVKAVPLGSNSATEGQSKP